VQVFTTTGEWRAEWVSRVGADNSEHLRSVQPYRTHVSSISYDAQLDLFAVSEGGTVTLRSHTGEFSSGCGAPGAGAFQLTSRGAARPIPPNTRLSQTAKC